MNSLVRLVQHLFTFSVYSLVQIHDVSAMSSFQPHTYLFIRIIRIRTQTDDLSGPIYLGIVVLVALTSLFKTRSSRKHHKAQT